MYTYDSITGISYYSEKHRGSGARNAQDGIQPDARENVKKKEYQRRVARERLENRKRQIEENRLKKNEDNPRSEKTNKNRTSGEGFFKVILILLIAIIPPAWCDTPSATTPQTMISEPILC